jgi:hypothetical protein
MPQGLLKWKQCGRKRLWRNLGVTLTLIWAECGDKLLSQGTRSVGQLQLEPDTSRIGDRNVTCSTTTLHNKR